MRPLRDNLEDVRYYLARPGTLREPQHSTLLEEVCAGRRDFFDLHARA
jgi:hypothetical protein